MHSRRFNKIITGSFMNCRLTKFISHQNLIQCHQINKLRSHLSLEAKNRHYLHKSNRKLSMMLDQSKILTKSQHTILWFKAKVEVLQGTHQVQSQDSSEWTRLTSRNFRSWANYTMVTTTWSIEIQSEWARLCRMRSACLSANLRAPWLQIPSLPRNLQLLFSVKGCKARLSRPPSNLWKLFLSPALQPPWVIYHRCLRARKVLLWRLQCTTTSISTSLALQPQACTRQELKNQVKP